MFREWADCHPGRLRLSYGQSEVSFYKSATFNSPPFNSQQNYGATTLHNPAGVAATVNRTPAYIDGSPTNYKTPYA
jgi:hypothetical protein